MTVRYVGVDKVQSRFRSCGLWWLVIGWSRHSRKAGCYLAGGQLLAEGSRLLSTTLIQRHKQSNHQHSFQPLCLRPALQAQSCRRFPREPELTYARSILRNTKHPRCFLVNISRPHHAESPRSTAEMLLLWHAITPCQGCTHATVYLYQLRSHQPPRLCAPSTINLLNHQV